MYKDKYIKCPAGQFSDEGTSKYSYCPEGIYSKKGSKKYIIFPSGTRTSNNGDEYIPYPERYFSKGEASKCSACLEGTYYL